MTKKLLTSINCTKNKLNNIIINHNKYFSFSIKKKSGKKRWLDSPSPELKKIQKNILYNILYKIGTHECAHGFITTRSPKTSALPHLHNKLILTVDLKDYFFTINYGRVISAFYYVLDTINKRYPLQDKFDVKRDSKTLADLCTYKKVLPQGAPTSPAIANIVTYEMDKALKTLSDSEGIVYTRYADDLTFSHPDIRYNMDAFLVKVKLIINTNGFYLNHQKTRFLRPHRRQSITGVVINDKLGVSKGYYKNTKAGIHNILTGKVTPTHSQLLKLRGRVEWIKSLDLTKGGKLLNEFKKCTS